MDNSARLSFQRALCVLLGQGQLESLLTLHGPDLLEFIVLAERGRSLRELHPRQFRLRVNVNIRPEDARTIKSADTNESERPAATIDAPEGNFALWAAIDVMMTCRARHRNNLQLTAEDFYG